MSSFDRSGQLGLPAIEKRPAIAFIEDCSSEAGHRLARVGGLA